MKVILQKDIQNLGEAGDIKDVSNGYARNNLLPKKLVIIADESSKKSHQHQEKLIKIKKMKRRKHSEKLFESLKDLKLNITAFAGDGGKLFGAVTSIDINKKLLEKGFEIDKRRIQLQEPIKQLGEYVIPVKLDDGITAEVQIIVEKG